MTTSLQATVQFPNALIKTTPLGVGLATLMREPSSKKQQRLLEVAYEAGFRHFDVAPSYGLGAAERVLGRFLQSHSTDVTIATKVGIAVRRSLMRYQTIQRPLRAMLRRFPALRGRATRAVGGAIHVRSNFSLPECTRSLENSLRALRTDSIDLLLLHDPEPTDLDDGQVLEWIAGQKARGLVGSIGIATSQALAAKVLSSASPYDALQVPSNVLAPASAVLPAGVSTPLRVTHSAIALPLSRIRERLAVDPSWAMQLSDCVGADVREPGVIAQLMLASAMHENSRGIVLVGASKPEHFRAAAKSIGAFQEAQFDKVAVFLRTSLAS